MEDQTHLTLGKKIKDEKKKQNNKPGHQKSQT